MAQKKPFGAGNPESANRKLEQTVRAKLEGDALARKAQIGVRADVTRNAVILTGTVPSMEIKERAVELAREAQAGVIVDDRLQVKAGEAGSLRRGASDRG